jgi:acetyl esterase
MSPRERVESRLGRLGASLSPALQLRLSGRPAVEIDGQVLDPGLQLVLALLERRGTPTVIGAAGSDPTPAEVRTRTRREALNAASSRTEVGSLRELEVAGGAGPVRARHYAPPSVGAGSAPLLVYLHGGGMTIGDLDTHDEPCRFFCRHAQLHVLSIEYRLAPEHPFPAPVEDAIAAFRWAAEHAAELGADPGRIAVGGDSAGGNLSAVVAQSTARDGGPAPALQLLIYPSTDYAHVTDSQRLFAGGFYLTANDRRWFDEHYLRGTDTERTDPRVSPLLAPDLSGLAPAIVVTAAFDLLRDEGEQYARALSEAGNHVIPYRAAGMIHGFVNMTLLRGPRDAMLTLAGMIRAALAP